MERTTCRSPGFSSSLSPYASILTRLTAASAKLAPVMNLYILRHASAGTRRVNPLLDNKRPLDKEGKQHCLQLAHALNALKISFDLVVSSPLKRSVQTAQLVATETGYEAPILLSNALAPEATAPLIFSACSSNPPAAKTCSSSAITPTCSSSSAALLMPSAARPKPSPVPTIRLRKGSEARLSVERLDRLERAPAIRNCLIEPLLRPRSP